MAANEDERETSDIIRNLDSKMVQTLNSHLRWTIMPI